jgi:hypothetical protein
MRLVAGVPAEFQRDGIRFLSLVHDVDETDGWYLMMHEAQDDDSKFDSWHEAEADAREEALEDWGVTPGMWVEG